MNFPQFISFTITNSCNLRCKMCGQWSEEGYIKNNPDVLNYNLKLDDWKKLTDEIAGHEIKLVLIRGGEPFSYPGIIELIEYINSKNIFMAIDTNGTIINKYAKDLVRIGNMHITFSVDGPENIHDEVRGFKGSFAKIKENISLFNKLEEERGVKISKSICFTISPFSYLGLGKKPDVARQIGISSVNIVPYYYFTPELGKHYEEEFKTIFQMEAFSWKGFQHEHSGIDWEIFKSEYDKYLSSLGEIKNDPFMPLQEKDYRIWFNDCFTPVRSIACNNVENLIDIQPNGDTNFCIDFPDYIIGSVKESTLKELWESPAASKFRNYRRKKPLQVCFRCGAKYMTEIRE